MSSTSKTLILIRHAKSSWKHEGLTDFERPLNGRGKTAAPFMGKKLHNFGLRIDQVISSPSKRTTQTAKKICKEINYKFSDIEFDNSIYNSSSENLLDIINTLDNQFETVILIGHNPAITYLSNFLQNDSYMPNVPTCGIVSITFEDKGWLDIGDGTGSLYFYEYPKKYI